MNQQVVKSTTELNRDLLLKEMKIAKGARFNASKRLEVRDRRRTSTIAYASASVIILTLLPAFFKTPEWLSSAISIATIAMSLIILAYSLLQAQSNDPVKADQFHRSALEINSLRRQFRALEQVTAGDIAKASEEYDSILARYNLNHDHEDAQKYRLEHPDEFPPLTASDAAESKKEVRSYDRFADNLTRAIIAVTVGAAAAATAADSAILAYLQDLFHAISRP